MKKILPLLLLFLSSLALAQTEKGSVMIGGNASVNFQNSDIENDLSDSKSFSVELNPLAGYFLGNNFSVGLALPLSWSKSKASYESFYPDYESSSRGTGVSPFIRYYIPVKSFYIVTHGGYSWTYSKYKYDSIDPVTGEVIGNNEFSNNSKSITLAAGPTFFINRHTAIEILANYEHNTFDDDGSAEIKTSRFFISVGFQIYLPKVTE